MFSIDQNSHSLWDVLPKLQALARAGRTVHHFVEDVDVAFTALGSGLAGGAMRLARERFHRSGGQDWGAALFYSEFLGRLPVEIRDWEPYAGMTTKALASRLGRGIDDLYDEFSPGDNWQFIGPSFVGDREHHRVIGDLSVAETAEFLHGILDRARDDMRNVFVQEAARRRAEDWLAAERRRLEGLLAECRDGKLTDLYRAWLRQYLGDGGALDAASSLLRVRAEPLRLELLRVFTLNYPLGARLYNEAVSETAVGLRPLDVDAGELPFFATITHHGHLVRTAVHLEGGSLAIDGNVLPLHDGLPTAEALVRCGVHCLAGKAVALVLQVRMPPQGRPLALPYRGSLYMPAVHRLEKKLCQAGLLSGPLHPVVRVRFHLLDRMAELDTVIHLPAHLRPYFGREEVPCREIAANWRELSRQAGERLKALRDDASRRAWQEAALPQLLAEIAGLDARRRELAKADPKSQEIRDLSRRCREMQTEVLQRTVRQIAGDWQLSRIDYWDSRGALLPWAVALGGESFYNALLDRAEIYDETPENAAD